MQLQQSAVKQYAISKGLNVLQPEKLKNPAFLEQLKALNADLQVVVAFRMLPEVVWNMPRLGTINLHASLLPQYRGAAPINWAIINGEKETGLTTFKLKHEIDTGHILLQEKLAIGEQETAGELHERMKLIGANLLVKTVQAIAEDNLQEQPQENFSTTAPLKHAPKIFTDTCRIDWTKPAREIFNLIRGLSPYPAAFTSLDDKLLKVYRATWEPAIHASQPGTHTTDGKSWLRFAAADGFVYITELQLEGKKKMMTEDFLKGYRKV